MRVVEPEFDVVLPACVGEFSENIGAEHYKILANRIGDYLIQDEIGQGGMGMVYLARDVRLDRQVAFKVLKPEFANNEAFVKRFLREAVAASQVVHPGVVNVTDFGKPL